MSAKEEEVVRRLVRKLLDEEYTISVYNGGDGSEIGRSSDYDKIVKELFATDYEELHVHKGDYNSVVILIYGNAEDGSEVIADYSGSLEDLIKSVEGR
jgi:hypothetical protein